MGVSTDAIIAFGWDLGDPYELVEDDLDDAGSLGEQFEFKLLEVLVDFTEKWTPESVDYYSREREAKERVGVEIVYHCSDDYPLLFLAAKGSQTRASRGYPERLDNLDIPEIWKNNLSEAAEILELKDLGEPAWYIFSMWG